MFLRWNSFSFSLLSGLTFWLLSLSFLGLVLFIFGTHLATLTLTHLAKGMLTFIFVLTLLLLLLASLQVYLHVISRKRTEKYQSKKHWYAVWSAVLYGGQAAPKTTDPNAKKALLDIAANLSDDYHETLLGIYEQTYLWKDLSVLESRRPAEVKSVYVESLAIIRQPLAIKHLYKAAHSKSSELRHLALLALAKTCERTELSRAQLELLFLSLFNSGKFSKGVMEEVLMALADKAELLIPCLLSRSNHLAVRIAALNAIAYKQNAQYLPYCLKPLDDPHPDIRAAALRALHGINFVPPEAYPALLKSLKDPLPFIRNQAVKACRGVLDTAINNHLLLALGDEDWWVRFNAAETLSQRGQAALEKLERAARVHPDPYARDIVGHVLSLA